MDDRSESDVLRDLDDDARECVARAEQESRSLGRDRVGTEHLLLGLIASSGGAGRALADAGASLAAARHKVAEASGPGTRIPPDPAADGAMTARAARALSRAVRFSHARRSAVVTPEHLLLGVLDVEGTSGQVLRGLGVDVARLRASLDADGEVSAAAPSTPATSATSAPATRAMPRLACPSCGHDLDAVVAQEVDVHSRDGVRTATAYGCSACGAVLGFAPR